MKRSRHAADGTVALIMLLRWINLVLKQATRKLYCVLK
jgi:hypothetical protein